MPDATASRDARGLCIPDGRLDRAFPWALALLIVVAAGPMLLRFGWVSSNPDWRMHLAFHGMARDAILRGGEYPLWCPYFGGGVPICGHPENPLPSPLAIPSILFGEVAGLKIASLLVWIVGGLGTYLFARRVARIGPVGAGAAAGVLALSAWFPQRLLSGNFNELCFFLFPLILTLFALSIRSAKTSLKQYAFGLGAAALVAVCLIDGKTCNLILGLMLLCLACFETLHAPRDRRWIPLAALAAVLAAAALFAAVKLVPMSVATREFLTGARRPYYHAMDREPVRGFPLWWILKHLVMLEREGGRGSLRYAYHWIGLLPAVCLPLAAILDWRRARGWLAAFAVSALALMGPRSPVDVFQTLRLLPGFHLIMGPAKYFTFPLVFAAAMLCGIAVASLWARAPGRLRRWLAWPLGLIVVGTLIGGDWRVLRGAFDEAPVCPARVKAFYQVRRSEDVLRSRRNPLSDQYLNLLRGVGTIDWNTALRFPERPRARYLITKANRMLANPAYRGEVRGPDAARPPTLRGVSYNRLRVEGARVGDLLVLNQNYHPGWRSRSGRVLNADGLLALQVTAESPDSVEMVFDPATFEIGLAVSLVSVLVAGLWLWREARRGRRRA